MTNKRPLDELRNGLLEARVVISLTCKAKTGEKHELVIALRDLPLDGAITEEGVGQNAGGMTSEK